MKRLKRGAALLLCLCMALSLCACGGGQNPAGDPVNPTEAAAPPEEESVTPPSGGPLPLSQLIQSGEPQILYQVDGLDKDERPEIYVFQNGEVVVPEKTEFSLGELSKMSDEEIVQWAMEQEEPSPYSGICTVFLRSDSTGNAVSSETLFIYNPQDQYSREIIFPVSHTISGQVYDSTYTGYWDDGRDRLFAARGEQAPFALDTIDAGDVEVDPKTLDTSFARIELIDGTRAPLPATCEDGMITSCAMTGDGHRLSLDDVKLTLTLQQLDISPSVLQTAEGRAALASSEEWYTETSASEVPPHENLIFFDGSLAESVKFYNAGDTEQELQNLTLSRIFIDLYSIVPDSLEGRTGVFDESMDSLLREYGTPSGAVMVWENRARSDSFKYPVAQITYYWAGDGFYIEASMESNNKPHNLMYVKSGLNEQELEAVVKRVSGTYDEGQLRLHEELNRLTAN